MVTQTLKYSIDCPTVNKNNDNSPGPTVNRDNSPKPLNRLQSSESNYKKLNKEI